MEEEEQYTDWSRENTYLDLNSDDLSVNEAKFLRHNLDTIYFSYIVQTLFLNSL